MPENAVGSIHPEIVDVTLELGHPCLRFLRLCQLDLSLLPGSSCLGVLTLNGLPQTCKPYLAIIDLGILLGNPDLNGLDSVMECPFTEMDDLMMGRAVVLTVV